jgi:nucleotide-binding universal stress UspA family protein
VARRAPEEAPFPTRILVGADGPGAPEDAIRIAAQLADACGCCVTLLRVGGWHHDRTYAVSRAAVELAEALGSEAVGMVVEGHPHRALVEIAAVENASLIIVGSRGLKGMHALVSTSERVAHEAGCSVLVLRHAKR